MLWLRGYCSAVFACRRAATFVLFFPRWFSILYRFCSFVFFYYSSCFWGSLPSGGERLLGVLFSETASNFKIAFGG